jgi:hypothetical protein
MKGFGVILAVIGSEALGLAMGEMSYRFFMKTVPPLAMTSLMSGTAHAAYLTYGAIWGLAILIWTLLVKFLSHVFSGSGKKKPAAA